MSDARQDSSEATSSQETVTGSSRDKPSTQAAGKDIRPSGPGPSTSPSLQTSSHPPRIPKRPHPTVESAFDTEPSPSKMGSSSKRHESGSSSKKHSSSSKSKSKPDDWSDITEPEERRRIQNRIAQRKFREKAKGHKEKTERDSRNQEHAGSSYHIPDSSEIADEAEVSGLPWGSISMRHVVARGHESESRRGNSGDGMRDENRYYGQYSSAGGGSGSDNMQSYSYSYASRDNSSGGGDFLDESSFYYPDYDGAGGDGSHR